MVSHYRHFQLCQARALQLIQSGKVPHLTEPVLVCSVTIFPNNAAQTEHFTKQMFHYLPFHLPLQDKSR